MSTRVLVLALALALVLVFAWIGPAQAQVWVTHNQTAIVEFSDDLALGVFFDENDGCNNALLIVTGNSDITTVGLAVDEEIYRPAKVQAKLRGSVGLILSDEALRALKHGGKALLVTDEGYLSFSLKGSAKALNEAYGQCLNAVPAAARPLQPKREPLESFGVQEYTPEVRF